MKKLILLFIPVMLMFAACSEESDKKEDGKEEQAEKTEEAEEEETVPELSADEEFASLLCECLGAENEAIMGDLGKELADDPQAFQTNPELITTALPAMGAMEECMNNPELMEKGAELLGYASVEEMQADESKEAEDRQKEAFKTQCNGLYVFISAAEALQGGGQAE